MSNKILENNLQILSKYNRKLAEKITGIIDLKHNYEIKEAKSGDSILFKDGIAVDDPVDPVWNALERYNKLEEKSNKGITILYGFGLGYVLKEFAKRYNGKIIVYEPNLEILRIVFELADFTQELANKKIRITADYDDIRAAYLALFFKDYKLNIVPLNYYENDSAENSAVFKEEIEKIHGTYQSNYRNLMEKGQKWTLSLFNNLPQVYKYQDLHALKDKSRGKTAVIISAGPSLDKNIQELRAYRDKVVVFCVGTALKTSLKYGIIPDFAVVIETSPNTLKQIDVPEISEINVINATNVFNGVFNVKPKCFLNYHLNKDAASIWLGELLQVPLKEYETAGTVSIIALFSAKMMGMDKIILIGQDLAYTNNQCYSKDSLYGGYSLDEKKFVSISDRDKFKNEVDVEDNILEKHMEKLSENLFYIKGLNGERVISRSDLILFITYFEEIAEKHGSEIKLVNSTEGGAYIKGYEHIKFKEALQKYTDEIIDKKELENSLKLGNKEFKKRKNILIKELSEIIKNNYEVNNLAEKALNDYILPSFSPQIAEGLEGFLKSYSRFFEIEILKLNKTKLTAEEEDLREKERENSSNFIEMFINDIKNLLKEDPQRFSENLMAIKNNYFALKNIIFKNVLLKNLNYRYFLLIDNQIKDFEDTDRDLTNLFSTISRLFLNLKAANPNLMNILRQTIKKIEE